MIAVGQAAFDVLFHVRPNYTSESHAKKVAMQNTRER